MTIIALVEHLAQRQLSYDTSIWGNWQIQPVSSGNNRLFRATSPDYDVVVKFLIRDDRHRAEREWSALTLLQRLNMPLGPHPVYCDQDRLPYAVVVQTWLEGQTISAPSLDRATWLQILQAYARLHQIALTDIARHAIVLPQIVGISGSEAEAKAALHEFAQRVPLSKHSVELALLLQRVDRLHLPSFSVTPCWCHGDANIRNILQTPQGIQFVDWEYTCYSDPAAEIALLMTHPLAQATIVFVQHSSASKPASSHAWAIHEQFDYQPDDTRLSKRHYNAFWETELDTLLQSDGVDFVVVSGYVAEFCVLSSVRGALERGYRSAILADGIAGMNGHYTQFTLALSPRIALAELELI